MIRKKSGNKKCQGRSEHGLVCAGNSRNSMHVFFFAFSDTFIAGFFHAGNTAQCLEIELDRQILMIEMKKENDKEGEKERERIHYYERVRVCGRD